MFGSSQALKLIKRQDFLEEEKNGRSAFRTGAKIHFSEKNNLGLGALLREHYTMTLHLERHRL